MTIEFELAYLTHEQPKVALRLASSTNKSEGKFMYMFDHARGCIGVMFPDPRTGSARMYPGSDDVITVGGFGDECLKELERVRAVPVKPISIEQFAAQRMKCA